MEAVAVDPIMARAAEGPGDDERLARLEGFRRDAYRCLTPRRNALFGLGDAVLCGDGPVTDLARLSLAAEFGRGHGALYDALNAGGVGIGRLRPLLAGVELPAWPGGGIRLAADVCSWLRPDAQTSPERLFCPVRGRGKNAKQMVAGWPYSFVAAVGPGRSSWTVLLDAVRLGPADDVMEVTAAQLREVVQRLIAAGQWHEGDPAIVISLDAGYAGARLAWLLRDLPVVLVVRVRSDRVYYRAPAPRAAGARGRRARHGAPLRCAAPGTWHGPDLETTAGSARHGPLAVTAWGRVHQMIHHGCSGWDQWPPGQEYPVIEGTLIRVAGTAPGLEPMWLWTSDPGAAQDPAAVAVLWQAYLRRFDIEHTFRFLKSQLGWDKAMLRDPAAADRWTWLIITCYTQLWLARDLAADIRLPWQRPRPRTPGAEPMTPGRVRAGFRVLRQITGTPASAGKYHTPGPGRPPGSRNKHQAPRYPAGKTTRGPSHHRKQDHKPGKKTHATTAHKG
jgi:DDE superfamily endonuclease